MTKLEKFVAFAQDLPEDRLAWLEAALDDLMHSTSAADVFTQEELAEIERRLAEGNPEMADPVKIGALLGRSLSD